MNNRRKMAEMLAADGHDPRLSWIGGQNIFAPPPVEQAEMRSSYTPMGDAAAQMFGPGVGPAISAIDRGAGHVVDFAKGVAMQPIHAGEAVGTAFNSPSIGNVTDAVVQSAMMIPTAKGIGTAFAAGTTGLAALGAKNIFGAAPANAEPSVVDIPTIKSRISEIDGQFKEIDAKITANMSNKAMSRKQTQEANDALRAEKDRLATERAGSLDKISAQIRMDSDTKAKEEKDRIAAGKPFSERHKEASQILTALTYPASAVLGHGIAGRVLGNVGAANAAARAATDPAEYATQRAIADQLSSAAPYKIAGGATAAATLPADMQILPDLIDYKTMPHDTEAYREAQKKFADPAAYAKSLAIPLMSGGIMSTAGAGKVLAADSSRGVAAAMKKMDGPDGKQALLEADNAFTSADKWRSVDAKARRADEHSVALTDEQYRLELEALRGINGAKLPPAAQKALKERLSQIVIDRQSQGQLPKPGFSETGPRTPPPPVEAPIKPTQPSQNQGSIVIPDNLPNRPNPNWAPHSDAARAEVLRAIDAGQNLTKGSRGVSITAPQIGKAIGDTAPGQSTIQNSIARLRTVLEANGVNLAMPNRARVEEIMQAMPREVFAVPAAIGLGAAASSHSASQPQLDPHELARYLIAQQNRS